MDWFDHLIRKAELRHYERWLDIGTMLALIFAGCIIVWGFTQAMLAPPQAW